MKRIRIVSAFLPVLVLVFGVSHGLSASAENLHLSAGPETEKERQSFTEALQHVRAGGSDHRELIVEAERVHDGLFSSNDASTDAYKHGDAYFLIGNLTDSWTKEEWTKFYSVAKWLVKQGFRNIINPVAYIVDLREAVQNPRTRVVIWSSHGNEQGTILDSADKAIPSDVFAVGAAPGFRHLVLSNCYGDQTSARYTFPDGLRRHFWHGETTTKDLFAYLYSDKWNADLETDLGIKF